MYLIAMRLASRATQKQSPGVDARQHRDGRLGVAAIKRLQQVRLLGLGRQARGRAAALDVANDQRQFDGYRKAHGFGLERHAGTGGGGDRQSAAVGCADRRGDRGDFVFGLEGHNAEVFVAARARARCPRPE